MMTRSYRLFGVLVGLLACATLQVSNAAAQGAPYCRAGESTQYRFGFASMKAYLGATMGDAAECEHPNSANGDTLQQTTRGLAFWRKSTNTPTFTDGWRHWALTSGGHRDALL